MKIQDLAPAKGSRKSGKRVGRGHGSGMGKTACRGHKGQKARSGGGPARGFEGGQMPLQRRLPKRGFKNAFRKTYHIVNVKDLANFSPDTHLDASALIEAGVIKRRGDGVKLLGKGEISHPLVVKVDKVSLSAKQKIEAAGGRVELI
jgi:large subunit ribosomal protein L15